jgi:hypothetical protein
MAAYITRELMSFSRQCHGVKWTDDYREYPPTRRLRIKSGRFATMSLE